MLRSDPDKLRAWQNRSRRDLPRAGRLRQRSPRRAREAGAIAAASTLALARDHHQCVAYGLVLHFCGYGDGLDVHHVIPRSVAPELVADPDNLVGVCRSAHDWIGDNPAQARALGLHGHAGDDPAALAQIRHERRLDRRLRAADGFGRPSEPDGP